MAKIIAELCQNHNGDRGLIKEMVAAAAEAGADFAKIQTIFSDELTDRPRFEDGLVVDGVTKVVKRPFEAELARLAGLEIAYDTYEWYIGECTAAGIAPLTTAFTRRQVAELARFPWREVKVASYDCASRPFLSELAEVFDHLYVSTGATFDDEIDATSKLLRSSGTGFTFLHCVTIYPTPADQLHLARMGWLRERADSVGFSDHSLAADGIAQDAVALLLGADVIERHFTVLGPTESRDGPVSVDPAGLRALCDLAHGSVSDVEELVAREVGDYSHMIGSSQRELSAAELANRDYYRGRFATPGPDGWIYNWEDVPLP